MTNIETADRVARELAEIYLREGIGHEDCGCGSSTDFRGVQFQVFNVYLEARRATYSIGIFEGGTHVGWHHGEFVLPG